MNTEDRSEFAAHFDMAPAVDNHRVSWVIDVDDQEDEALEDAGYTVYLTAYNPLLPGGGVELHLTPDSAKVLAGLLLRFAGD